MATHYPIIRPCNNRGLVYATMMFEHSKMSRILIILLNNLL